MTDTTCNGCGRAERNCECYRRFTGERIDVPAASTIGKTEAAMSMHASPVFVPASNRAMPPAYVRLGSGEVVSAFNAIAGAYDWPARLAVLALMKENGKDWAAQFLTKHVCAECPDEPDRDHAPKKDPRDWPHGGYMCRCLTCTNTYTGPKRTARCWLCKEANGNPGPNGQKVPSGSQKVPLSWRI